MQKWIMNPYRIKNKSQYYRFITSGFLHGNLTHLLFNMITFYFFGSRVESIFHYIFGPAGSVIFIFFYLTAIVVSDIPTYLKHREHPHYNAIGASGGVSAVLFSSILYNPTSTIFVFFIPLPGFIVGALYLLYSFQKGKDMSDNINHDAHLYGGLFGIVFTLLVDPGVIPRFFEQLTSFRLF